MSRHKTPSVAICDCEEKRREKKNAAFRGRGTKNAKCRPSDRNNVQTIQQAVAEKIGGIIKREKGGEAGLSINGFRM